MSEKKNDLLDYFIVFADYAFNWKEWGIFLKRGVSLVLIAAIAAGLWFFPISLFVAPFYSWTTGDVKPVTVYKDLEGKTTVMSVRNGLKELLDEGLVTNFLGVRTWIDNRYYEQVGEIEIYRVAVNTLENNLARNRGTGGANPNFVQARADVYADYELPYFTSYSTRLKQAIGSMDEYLIELKADQNVPMNKKKAVFIVNSDNLAEVLDKMKQQLQTNLIGETNFFTEDDKFYRIRGNLIAMYKFLQGIDYDFKGKMIDKTSYEENFVPIMESLKKAIDRNPLVIMEVLGHVSKIEKDANVIAQKLAELRDKLRNG